MFRFCTKPYQTSDIVFLYIILVFCEIQQIWNVNGHDQVQYHISTTVYVISKTFILFSGLETNKFGWHNFDYVFFPIPRNSIIRFKVKTGSEAHIVLSKYAHHINIPTHEVRNVSSTCLCFITCNVKAGQVLTCPVIIYCCLGCSIFIFIF